MEICKIILNIVSEILNVSTCRHVINVTEHMHLWMQQQFLEQACVVAFLSTCSSSRGHLQQWVSANVTCTGLLRERNWLTCNYNKLYLGHWNLILFWKST